MDKGKLLTISGFSGVGKGTIVEKMLEAFDNYKISISCTTRDPRPAEEDGVHYHFISKDEFEKMIENDELLEHAKYVDNYYGTPTAPLHKMSSEGTDVLLDLTIAGSLALKEKFEQAVTIFILPPSYEELRNRLTNRGTETAEVIERRLGEARSEIERANEFDYVVVNDDLDEAVAKVLAIIEAEKCRYKHNQGIEKRTSWT